MVDMSLERSRPVFRSHRNLYWVVGLVLAYLLGAATFNGIATQTATDAAYWQCHLTLQSAERHQ